MHGYLYLFYLLRIPQLFKPFTKTGDLKIVTYQTKIFVHLIYIAKFVNNKLNMLRNPKCLRKISQ